MRTRLASALALGLALAPGMAHANSFIDLVGGLTTPVSDDQWQDYVESSPKLGVRLGSVSERAGGMLMLDWTPLATDDTGFGDAIEASAHRFRVQVAGIAQHRAGSLTASFRFGGGIDIARATVRTNIIGFESEATDTHIGLALEPGFGLWFDVGSVQVGGELALPISFHDDGEGSDVDLEEYTSVDLDLLFAVRFRQ